MPIGLLQLTCMSTHRISTMEQSLLYWNLMQPNMCNVLEYFDESVLRMD